MVTLGKSSGATTVAGGIALQKSAVSNQRVLFAELDPAGGELVEKLVFDGQPTAAAPKVPAGARELADVLAGADAGLTSGERSGPVSDVRLEEFLYRPPSLSCGLAVLVGDPLTSVAAESAAVVGPKLGELARGNGFDVVVIDGGRWNSDQGDRLVGVDVVFAVVQGDSTSQLHRCVAEMQALWRQLQSVNSGARMVVVLNSLGWATEEVVSLFISPPGVVARETAPYRVLALQRDRKGLRAASQIRDGKWGGVSVKGLAGFNALSSVLGEHEAYRQTVEIMEEPETSSFDEFPYLPSRNGDGDVAEPSIDMVTDHDAPDHDQDQGEGEEEAPSRGRSEGQGSFPGQVVRSENSSESQGFGVWPFDVGEPTSGHVDDLHGVDELETVADLRLPPPQHRESWTTEDISEPPTPPSEYRTERSGS